MACKCSHCPGPPGRPAGRPNRRAATCAIHGQPILASPKPRETSTAPLTSSPLTVSTYRADSTSEPGMLPRARACFPYARRSAVVKECGNGTPMGVSYDGHSTLVGRRAYGGRGSRRSSVRCQPVDAQRGRSVRFDRPKREDVVCA